MSANGEHIQRKMREVRQELAVDAGQLVESTRRLTHWREYVRANPWLFAGSAVALGYFVAPRRSGDRRSGGKADDAGASSVAGGTMLGLVVASVGRAAMTMATRTAMNAVNERLSRSAHVEAHEHHGAYDKENGDDESN